MIKPCHKKALFFVALLLSPLFYASAADLSLTYIGALATEGKKYTEWWYTASSALLKGMAPSEAEVKITVNDKESTVDADSSGNWSFQVDGSGDKTIKLSSEGVSYNFVLHLGQALPDNITGTTSTTETTTSVPETGSSQLAGLAFGLSLALLGFYIYYDHKTQNNKVQYEQRVLNSLEDNDSF